MADDRETYTYLPESAEGFSGADQLVKMIEEAGWSDVSYKKVGMGSVAIHLGKKASKSRLIKAPKFTTSGRSEQKDLDPISITNTGAGFSAGFSLDSFPNEHGDYFTPTAP